MKLDSINLSIGSYPIKLLFVAYWLSKQSIHSKNTYNYEKVKHFSPDFAIYRRRIN